MRWPRCAAAHHLCKRGYSLVKSTPLGACWGGELTQPCSSLVLSPFSPAAVPYKKAVVTVRLCGLPFYAAQGRHTCYTQRQKQSQWAGMGFLHGNESMQQCQPPEA